MFREDFYADRYYNGMSEHISNDKKNTLYFVPTFLFHSNINKIINICGKAKENFLYKFDVLSLKDYIFTITSPFRIRKIDFEKYIFNDFKIGPLLKSDYYKNIANVSSFEGILNYLFLKRLKEYDIRLSVVINWFENQVMDRGFNKGLNDYFPNVRSIG